VSESDCGIGADFATCEKGVALESDEGTEGVDMTKEQEALRKFLDTIVATGGLIQHEDGRYGCAAEEDWLDLADCALLALDVLQEAGIVIAVPVRSEAVTLGYVEPGIRS
jgi:hypothetical protein